MNNHKKTLKTVVFSLGLAAMMVPATMNAQINRGLLENPYKDNSGKNHGMMNHQNNRGSVDINDGGISIQGIGQSDTAPLGSGIAILLGLGLGYVALKKKED